jgi:radical SAM protein with 4Fe4S-binding SPASM domain
VLEHEGQRVLINPANREWIKLADYAYELARNPEGKPMRQLVLDEALQTGVEPETIESLFHYLKEYGFLAEVSDMVALARAYLNVTARCNLTCPMCYFVNNYSPGYEESSCESLFLTIDALAEAGVSSLVISGGEPLLSRDFRGILNYSMGKFPMITILTNGTLITDEDARHISKANAKVQVSIESANRRVHDSIRGRGSFNKAIEGIKMLLRAGARSIEIVQTLTRDSIHESGGVVELAGTLGVGYHFSLFLPVGRGVCHMGDMEIPTDELLRHFVRVCNASLERGRETGSEASDSSDLMPPVELIVKQGCGAGSSIISIAPDGKVYPCPVLHTEGMVLGELPDEPIWEIIRRGGRRIPDITWLPECSDCDVALFCGGGCRARAFAHTGDVTSKDPYCGFYQRVLPAFLWEWREDRTFSDNMDAILSSIRKGE